MRSKPNLLFIFSDQQRFDTMACYGNEIIQTPHLDALAQKSFVFENAYVSQPVCVAARTTIMTGLYPHTLGMGDVKAQLPPAARTIAEMVSEEYCCGYNGKWDLGDEVIPQHGFEEWVSTEDLYRGLYSSEEYLEQLSSYHHFLVENGFEPDREREGSMVFDRGTVALLPEHYTKAMFQGREAARFIKKQGDHPFILYVGYLEPHQPYDGPLNGLYPRDNLATGPQFFRMPPDNAALKNRATADYYLSGGMNFGGLDFTHEAAWRELRARYWGNVTLVDRSVGVILDALEESGQADNTIVVFTSDHGEMAGDHGMRGKVVMYEESIRVPLLVRVPWMGREGRRVPGAFGHIDLVPTLLDLMGEPLASHLEGESRVPALRGESTLEGNDVIIEWNEAPGIDYSHYAINLPAEEINRVKGMPWRTLVAGDGWKLNLSPVDQCELYDLNADPHELENLFDHPQQHHRVRDMAARIRAWQERTGDAVPLPQL